MRRRPRPAAPLPQFVLRPLTLSVLAALAAPALAGPTGGQVVAGQATIAHTAPGQQHITQGSQRAVIDWQGFSIGAGESLHIQQPSASAVLLNRVVGHDPSHILGQMQANGRVFLLNPYGVVFGAGARVDVGGLVASTLDMSNADFMAGTFRLGTAGGGVRGIVRNDGSISAPGGTVALVGPTVANHGTITADGGRIGLAAANSVLVDVEGDGLIFFQADATEATNRLEQLGRLQADGGSVELRAAARGAFADTVLNLGGTVQARALAQRGGRIVIGSTADGIVQVDGLVDASSPEAGRGGGITVEGERMRLTGNARLDASGAAGGGSVQVGGGFQGQDPALRNALVTTVADGAQLLADATQQGDGGEIVVWADDTTRFAGAISARGGAAGGNGGDVEVSGKQTLLFRGDVDTRAPLGERGTLLLDPDNLIVGTGTGAVDDADVSVASGEPDVTVSAAFLSGYTGAAITLTAAGDITFEESVINANAGTSLTAVAGGALTVNDGKSIQVAGDLRLTGASLSLRGNLTSTAGQVHLSGPVSLRSNDIAITGASVVVDDTITSAQRALAITATAGGIALHGNVTLGQAGDALSLSATGGAIEVQGLATNNGAITLSSASGLTLAGDIASGSAASRFTGPVTLAADVTVTASGSTFDGSISGAQALSLLGNGVKSLQAVDVASLTTGSAGSTLLAGDVTTSGDQRYGNAVIVAADVTLDAGSGEVSFSGALDGTTADTESVSVSAGGGTTFGGAVGGTTRLAGLSVSHAARVDGARIDAVTQTYGSLTIGADATLAGSSVGVGGATTQAGSRTLVVDAATSSLGAVAVDKLTVHGTTTLHGNVSTGDTQQYGNVVLGADVQLTAAGGSDIDISGTLTGGHALATSAGGTTRLRSAVNIGSLATGTSGGTEIGANVGSITTSGGQSYGNAVWLSNDAVLTAGAGGVNFASTIGGARTLSIDTPGETRFQGAVGGSTALTSLATDAGGSTRLGASLYTTGNQTFADAVTLTAATAIDANAVQFGNGLALGAHDLVLQLGGNFGLAGAASGSGFVSLAPRDASQAIYIGSGAAGSGEVSFDLNPLLSAGITRIGVGRSDGSGTLRVGALTLAADTKLQTGSGHIVFTDAITGSHELAVDSASGRILLQGVTIDTGSAAQSYAGTLRLTGSNTLRGGSVSLGGNVDGTFAGLDSLRIQAAGGLALQGAVGTSVLLGSFVAEAPITLQQDTAVTAVAMQFDRIDGGFALGLTAGSVDFRGDIGATTALASLTSSAGEHRFRPGALRVETTGDQRYNGATRIEAAGLTLVGEDIAFDSGVTGTGASLTVTAAGTAGFGSTVSLAALSVDGTGSTTLAGNVSTSGGQHYGNAVSLAGNVMLGAGSAGIHFADTVDGAHTLAVNTTGTTRFDGALGGSTALASLDTTGSAATVLGADVSTTGAQTYGALTLTGDVHLTSTAGTIGFTGTTVSLASLEVTGTASLASATITTSGSQWWHGTLAVAGSTILASSGSGLLRFDGAIDGPGSLTVNNAGTTAFNAAIGASQALASLDTDAAGSTTLAGDVRTSGALTVKDALTLGANATVTAGSATFAAAVGGAYRLTVNASGATAFGGAVDIASLATDANGGTTLTAAVRTSGAQSYGDRVTLAGDFAIESGGALGFAGGITAGSHALTLRAGGTLTVGDTVTGSGVAVIEPVAVGTSLGIAGGTGSLQISQATLDRFAGLASLALGRSDGSGAIDVGNLLLPTSLTLRSGSGTVNFGGTVDSAAGFAHGLVVDTAALTTFAGNVGAANALGSLTLTHAAQLDAAEARTNGTQHYGGALAFGGDTALHAPALRLDAGLAAGAHDVALFTDSLSLAGSVSGTGSARLAALNAGGSIGLAGAGGTLQLSQSLLDRFAGLSQLHIGRSDGTGAIDAHALALGTDTTLHTGSGPVTLSAVNGHGHALAVHSAGSTRFGGPVAGVSMLGTDAAGTTIVAADIISSGDQHFGDALTLDASATLTSTAGSLRFGGSVGGAHTLATDAAAGTRFDGTVSLAALQVQQAASVNGGSITTSGAQHWGGAVALGADTRFTGSSLTFAAGVSGSHALTLNADTTLHDDVHTGGAQHYDGALTLAGDVRLTSGGGIGFSGTVSGPHALTVDAAGGAHIGGTVNIGSLDMRRAASLGNASITTSGGQHWRGALELAGTATLDSSGAGEMRFDGAIDGPGALAVHTGGVTLFNAAIGATQALAALSTDAGGSTTLAGNVSTSGALSFGDALTLAGHSTVTAGAATFASTVDGAHTLTVDAAGLTRFAGAVGSGSALAALSTDAAGSTQVEADITTSGLQHYGDTVTLGADSNFTAGALVFDGALAAGSFQLGLQADALTLNGAVSGSGTVALAPSLATTTIGLAGGAGSYQLGQATLSRFTGFSTLSIGRADGSGDMHVGHLVLPMNTVLHSGSGTIHLEGGIDSAPGAPHTLAVHSAAATRLGGSVGGGAALGRLHIDGDLVVTVDTTLEAGAIELGGELMLGTHDLALHTDALTLGAAVTGSGSARLASLDAAGSIGIAGGAGTLQLSQSLLDRFAGLPQLTLGRGDGSGAITAGAFSLPTSLAIGSASGAVTLAGAVDSAGSAQNLRIATGGLITLAGDLGGSSALGSLAFDGAVMLAGDTRIRAHSVDVSGTLDGAHALLVDAAATRFGGMVGGSTALASLSTDAAGRTTLGAGVRTSGEQHYGDDVVLAANSTLQAAAIGFGGAVDAAVDGAHSLRLEAAETTFGGAIGGTARLASLTTTGRATLAGGGISTTGTQGFGGAVTLAADTTLEGAGIDFAGTVDGAHALVLRSSGLTRFGASVGGAEALASLDAQLGTVQLAGAGIETHGAQHYGGALLLNGHTRLAARTLAFDGAVSGAGDLQLQADSLAVGAGLAGSGVLTLATRDATRSIGLAGGNGALQITQAVLDAASGFTHHVIGRSDGSGTVNVGALTLRANTTLRSGSADLRLDGGVNGDHDLALESGGITRISRDIGTQTAVRSLRTDNQAGAADWNGSSGEHTRIDSGDGRAVRIVTSGAQTFLDPLVTGSAAGFRGSTLSALHAANAFGGPVSITADVLQWRSASDLRLADVSLAGGGEVQADGRIELAGALQLHGGTLALVAQAAPSAIGFTDPALDNPLLNLRGVALAEASAGIFQSGGALTSSAGSLLSLRTPGGGSILLEQVGNALAGRISAVSGTPGEDSTARFENAGGVTLGFVRIRSSEIHVAGSPPAAGEAAGAAAGLEADAIKLATDRLTTGPDGQIRARLPYENLQGSQTSVPGLTLVMGEQALSAMGGFGGASPDSWVQVHLGGATGGFLSVLPKGAGGRPGSVLIGGRLEPRPFYDGEGKLGEVRMFYNGAAPRTPQEQGALTAVTATVEEARQARFDDAVRTENVSSRLRAGVIAEVGAGRPATVGSEIIRMPEVCDPAPGRLQCE